MSQKHWFSRAKTPFDIYQQIFAEPVAHLLMQTEKGNLLPLSPETNVIEVAIQEYAANDFDQAIQPLEKAQSQSRKSIQDSQVNSQQAITQTEEYLANGHYLKNECLTQCQHAQKKSKHSEQVLNAYRKSMGIDRPIQQASKKSTFIISLSLGVLDTLFNGFQLFASTKNLVEKGLIEAWAIAGLVSLVNLLAGYLCGEHLWRYLLRVNQSSWRWAAWVSMVIIVINILIINFCFAYLRAFGHIKIQLPVNISTQQYISFFGVFLVGVLMFTWIVIKWSKTNDPIIQYERLHREYQADRQDFKNEHENASKLLNHWLVGSLDNLDSLLEQSKTQLTEAQLILNNCIQFEKQAQSIRKTKQQFYTTVILYARKAIIEQRIPNTPTYFFEEPKIDFKNNFETESLGQQLNKLNFQLDQLTKIIHVCRKKILIQDQMFHQAFSQLKEVSYAND